MNPIKVPYCDVEFESTLDLERIGTLVSESLFAKVPFGGRRNWFDELPSIRLTHDILGLKIFIVQSLKTATTFWLLIDFDRPTDSHLDSADLLGDLHMYVEPSQSNREYFPNRLNLTSYVATLLKDIPELQVK